MNSKLNFPQLVNFPSDVVRQGNRTFVYYDTPATLTIGGETVDNVTSYSACNYQDAATKNGRLYNINKQKSQLSLYTSDGKFLRSTERMNNEETLRIGGREFFGNIAKTILPDKKVIYEVTQKLGSVKQIIVNPDGTIILPKLNLIEKVAKFLKK